MHMASARPGIPSVNWNDAAEDLLAQMLRMPALP